LSAVRLLDAARIAGVAVVGLLSLRLLPVSATFSALIDDDVVAAVHVRGEHRLVLATQTVGDDGREPPEDEALGVDQRTSPCLISPGLAE
jgi:hypothetical protein